MTCQSARTFTASLGTERDGRIDASGTPRRNGTRDDSGAAKDRRDADERERIVSGNAEQEPAKDSGTRQGHHDPGGDAEQHQSDAIIQDEPSDVVLTGTNGHAHADFTSALRGEYQITP